MEFSELVGAVAPDDVFAELPALSSVCDGDGEFSSIRRRLLLLASSTSTLSPVRLTPAVESGGAMSAVLHSGVVTRAVVFAAASGGGGAVSGAGVPASDGVGAGTRAGASAGVDTSTCDCRSPVDGACAEGGDGTVGPAPTKGAGANSAEAGKAGTSTARGEGPACCPPRAAWTDSRRTLRDTASPSFRAAVAIRGVILQRAFSGVAPFATMSLGFSDGPSCGATCGAGGGRSYRFSRPRRSTGACSGLVGSTGGGSTGGGSTGGSSARRFVLVGRTRPGVADGVAFALGGGLEGGVSGGVGVPSKFFSSGGEFGGVGEPRRGGVLGGVDVPSARNDGDSDGAG